MAASLMQSDARFAGLEMLATAVVVVGSDGVTLHLNPAAELLFDISARMTVGHVFARLFSQSAELERLLSEGFSHAFEQKRTELVLERPGREPVSVLITACAVDQPAGAPAGIS